VHVKTDPNVSLHVGSTAGVNGEERYEGSLGHLRFHAVMDRSCSWWNPNARHPDYTLQHEQVHFAIREIAARRLNQAAAALVADLHVTEDDEHKVVLALRTRVEQLFNVHNDAAVSRNRAFDEETSPGPNEERQDRWWRDVQRELHETEAWR
jgi:hypothetical protein